MRARYVTGVSALGVALLCALVVRIASAPPPQIPPPPEELEWDDIHPLFWAWVGDPENPAAQWTSRRYLYEGGQPIAPIYIAVGETIHCKDMSEDLDTVADGQSSMEDDIASWAWSPAGSGSGGDYHKTVQAGDGEFIVECTVDDAARYENDDAQASKMKFRALPVHYVVVRPNSNPEVIDISQEHTRTFTGYAYNLGLNPDGSPDDERHFDYLGNPIGGTADNDILLAATFHWTVPDRTLAWPAPDQDTASTTLHCQDFTGCGTLTATYEVPEGGGISGSAAFMITRGDYFIDLVGINYDEVQNVPINGKAPAARDGTGNLGEMKAKVVIKGDPNTNYSVTVEVDVDPPPVELVGAPTSLTTDDAGNAEQEFVIRASTAQPSPELEDVVLQAFLGGTPVQTPWTVEFITVYMFAFEPTFEANEAGKTSSGGAAYDTGANKVSTGSDMPGVDCGAFLGKTYQVKLQTAPSGSLDSAVGVKANAKVTHDADMQLHLIKGHTEDGPTVGISVTYMYVGFSVSAAGSNEIAATGAQMSVKMGDKAREKVGSFHRSTADFDVPFPLLFKTMTYNHSESAEHLHGEQHTYHVDGPGIEVQQRIDIGADTTYPYDGLGFCGCSVNSLGSNYIEADLLTWGSFREEDGVYEIQ